MEGYIARICTSFIDVPDEIAVAIYFAGCSIRCKDCQNPELWNRDSGKLITDKDIVARVKENILADYVVFLGGEPTDQIEFLIRICEKIRFLKKALYTGREFEDLPSELLNFLDLVICGPYRSDLHVEGRWPASSNQRVFRKEKESWICII